MAGILLIVILGAKNPVKGKLFIIGGGKRTDAMINRLIEEAGIREQGYVFILPMASGDPDSAIMWSGEQFLANGISRVTGYNFKEGVLPDPVYLDSLRKAPLVFISGGDQSRFMNAVRGTEIYDAIHQAYRNGSVIAGTSAGAAVMSLYMITGDELRHPEYHETFRCIETRNIEFREGLGLLKTAIIDQHFVVRSRHNRLITAVFEKPELPGIGIDEATAILVSGRKAEVVGDSQVLVFRNRAKSVKILGDKMGQGKISLEIHLPGDRFNIL